MIEIKKSSTNYNIVDSGTIINFEKNDAIRFDLNFENTFKFAVELIFEDNENDEKKLSFHVIDEENLVRFNCENFTNAMGTGTNEPIELATFQEKKVYFHFWVYSLGSGACKRVEYSVFMER